MSVRNHISHLTSTCFGVLRQIHCIQRSLSSHARTMLVTCFISARLDDCNAMFKSLPYYNLDCLQAVQNAAVRLIAGARKFDHVTPLLREDAGSQSSSCITFKMAVMTYKFVHGTTADYLVDYIRPPSSAIANLFYTCDQPVPVACLCLGQRLPPGPIFCSCWSTLVEQSAYPITSAGSLAIFRKQLKISLFRTAYD